MELQSLIEELERQKPLKWDKKINSSNFEMALVENHSMFHIQGDQRFSITKSCHSQIAGKLEISFKYYNKMETESPELLVENVNTWLKKSEKRLFYPGIRIFRKSFFKRQIQSN